MYYENNLWEMWNRVIAKQIIALERDIQWPLVFSQLLTPQDRPPPTPTGARRADPWSVFQHVLSTCHSQELGPEAQ